MVSKRGANLLLLVVCGAATVLCLVVWLQTRESGDDAAVAFRMAIENTSKDQWLNPPKGQKSDAAANWCSTGFLVAAISFFLLTLFLGGQWLAARASGEEQTAGESAE